MLLTRAVTSELLNWITSMRSHSLDINAILEYLKPGLIGKLDLAIDSRPTLKEPNQSSSIAIALFLWSLIEFYRGTLWRLNSQDNSIVMLLILEDVTGLRFSYSKLIAH
jgi:hypothetical protein